MKCFQTQIGVTKLIRGGTGLSCQECHFNIGLSNKYSGSFNLENFYIFFRPNGFYSKKYIENSLECNMMKEISPRSGLSAILIDVTLS